jgi:hypothetical protein
VVAFEVCDYECVIVADVLSGTNISMRLGGMFDGFRLVCSRTTCSRCQ